MKKPFATPELLIVPTLPDFLVQSAGISDDGNFGELHFFD